MNATERMHAAINLKQVDRVPNAPFYEAPICTYFRNYKIHGIRERFPELTAEVFSEKRMFRGRNEGIASEAFCRKNSLFQPAEDSDQYLPEICHFCLEYSLKL